MTDPLGDTDRDISDHPAGRPPDDDGLRLDGRRPETAPRRGVSRAMLLTGVAGAAALGLLFGVFARPELAKAPSREPMRPVTASAEADVTPVPVEVAAVTPAPAPPPTGKLEVLPPDLAQAAEARAPVQSPAQPPVQPPTRDIRPPAARREPGPVREIAPPPMARGPTPSFDCGRAGSRAERMVCEDAVLARLDRRLDRAFRRAVAAGVPYGELRAEQDDWLAVREDAARRSPDAVESIYRQRIAELDDLGR